MACRSLLDFYGVHSKHPLKPLNIWASLLGVIGNFKFDASPDPVQTERGLAW
jgi:hypothetical protein